MMAMINMLTTLLGMISVPALIITIIVDIVKGKFMYSKRVLIVLVISFIALVALRFLGTFMGWS